jgi:hypothetical protein
MVVALTVTPTKTRNVCALALTGAAATTSYQFLVSHPGGGIETITAITSGAGAVTVNTIPWAPGTVSVTVYPTPTAAGATIGPITATVAP